MPIRLQKRSAGCSMQKLWMPLPSGLCGLGRTAAKERIVSLLPPDQKAEFTALFDEFEAYETAEAKFAHSMDNLQPLLLNNSNGGGDWKEHGVSSATVYTRQSKTKLGSEKLYEVTDRIIQENIRKGNLKE